jgi:hypothetical protein
VTPQWLQLIIVNRPKHGEVEDFVDINDIRNGVLASNNIHIDFDSRHIVILKVSRVSAYM